MLRLSVVFYIQMWCKSTLLTTGKCIIVRVRPMLDILYTVCMRMTQSKYNLQVVFGSQVKITGFTTHGNVNQYQLMYRDSYGLMRIITDDNGENKVSWTKWLYLSWF
jgi:hypothetical protein